MIIFITFLYFLASSCSARQVDNVPHNMVTVPPNCPDGQTWVNGQCRDVWTRVTAAPANVITVPPNCPPGQQFINGQCRDIWFKSREPNNFGEILSSYAYYDSKNVVTVPPNCRPGQQWINGSCRDVWRSGEVKNVITVPTNCLPGEEFVNGQCREIWRRLPNLIENFINDFKNTLTQREKQVDNQEDLSSSDDANRNVISVPNQCPAGYRPDPLGVCRQIFN